MRRVLALTTLAVLGACGGSDGSDSQQTPGTGSPPADAAAPRDSGTQRMPGVDADTAPDAARAPMDAAGAESNIRHVVVIVMENHTFDAYFGRYCTAAPGSSPACNTGPACCEAAPETDPSGAAPVTLDDSENSSYDPSHDQACELTEMNGGAMDRYVTGASCSNAKNFAIAPPAQMGTYFGYAGSYALADRYFQPLVGASSSNDMYFPVARYVFTDNSFEPDSNGKGCNLPPAPTAKYTGETTIADLLMSHGETFAFYAEGYQAMLDATFCPLPPSDCPAHLPTVPCDYANGDNPFQFYAQLTDNKTVQKDFSTLLDDISAGTLPSVAFVKPLQYHDEHPGYGTTLTAGSTFVSAVVEQIMASPSAEDTLVLLTWDEGGGFFDHVRPPPDSTVDQKPYGTRVPMLALGRFARKNFVSHTVMEHSSVVRFLEYNFLHASGQLGARDAVVNNIGSMLDPAETGLTIPEN